MIEGLRRFAVTSNTRGNRTLIGAPSGQRSPRVMMGSQSAYRDKQMTAAENRRYQATAAGEAFGLNQGGFSGTQTVISKNIAMGMLEEFLPQDRHIRNRIFRDIYYHDAIAGGAVDIYATMPWSDFYLVGLRDKDVLDTYHKSVENMKLKLLLPAISRDFLAMGTFIGTSVFDTKENSFTAVMPQNLDFCTITEVPFYGMDPLIDLKIPESLSKIISNRNDPRIKQIVDNLPEYMQQNFKSGSIPLMPENTLYIPRRSLSSDSLGTSYFERILPIHLMEKALWRGSIDQAYRRQRSILHITVGGDGDDYVPTLQDMESQRDLWLAADMDPTGAIIITRTGISPNEVRNASDFWRVDEVFDFFSTAKYRALGINEAFITGEAQFNVMDAAMTVFIEGMRAFRSSLTQEIFYNKIFPAIALANDYTKDRYTMLGKNRMNELDAYFNERHNAWVVPGTDGMLPYGVCADTRHGLSFHDKDVRVDDLAMPHIIWQKHLRPEGDEAYMNLLDAMAQKGIPVPLSMMAMAGGIDIYAALNNQDEEIKLRKRVKSYQEKVGEYQITPQGSGADDSDDGSAAAQANVLQNIGRLDNRINRFGINRPRSLFGREFDERHLPHNRDKNGKFRLTSSRGKKDLREKLDRTLARVLASIAEKDNAQAKSGRRKLKTMLHKRLGMIK
jgi:hypothetical protein